MIKTTIALTCLLLFHTQVSAEEKPEDTVKRLIKYSIAGKTNDAETCYSIRNDRQRAAARDRSRAGEIEMMTGEAVAEPLRSFTESNCAVVVMLLLHTNAVPPKIECTRCCMVLTTEGWRLLPESPHYAGPVNRITPAEEQAFRKLWPAMEQFRLEEESRRRQHTPNQAMHPQPVAGK